MALMYNSHLVRQGLEVFNSIPCTKLGTTFEALTSQLQKTLDLKPDRIVVLHVYGSGSSASSEYSRECR